MDAHMETQMVGADLKVHKVIEIEEDNTASANKEFEITQTHVVSSENQKLGTQIQVSKLSQLLEKKFEISPAAIATCPISQPQAHCHHRCPKNQAQYGG
jgi:hypothetical protein